MTAPQQRRLAVMLLAAAVLWPLSQAGCKKRGTGKTGTTAPASPYDTDYTAALAAADMFCQAWKTRDLGTGEALLSARLKARHSPQRIREVIMGQGNPRHAAYEIFDGKRLDDGGIAFSVRLFYRYTGMHYDRIEAPLERIVMTRNKTGQWQVDEFPIP